MMHWQYNPYVLPLVITAAISATIAFFAWRRRPAPGAMSLFYLMLAVCEWSLGYAVGMASADLPAKVFWAKVQYFGIVSVPILWLFLALQYTGRESCLTRRNRVLLAIMPLLTLLLAWTNESHGLIWSDIRLDTSGSFSVLYLSYGAFVWVWVMYSYPLILLGSVLLLQVVVRSPHLYRQQAAAMLIAALAPWVGNVLRISGLNPFPQLDPTNFAFTLSGLMAAWALFRFRLLDIVPVARDAVIESMDDGVIVLDAQNRIVDINPAAGLVFGCSVSETIGQPAAQVLYCPLDLVERYRDATEAQGEIVLGKGEAQRIFDLHISPLYDQHDRLTGRLVVLRDFTERKRAEEELREYRDHLEELVEERTTELTQANEQLQREIAERKQAEEALRESEERYRIIADNTYDWEFWISPDGRFLYNSPSCQRITGHTADEFARDPGLLDRIIHPEDRERFMLHQHQVAEKKTPDEIEFRILLADGSMRYIGHVCQPVFDEQGQYLGKRGSNRDITERKRAENELRKFKTISDKAGYGVSIVDLEGNVIYNNAAYDRMHGYTPGELTGKHLSTFHTEQQMAKVNTLIEQLNREGSYVAEEVWHKRNDNTEFPTLMTGTLIKDENGTPLFMAATAIDITERKRAEEVLLESEERYRSFVQNLDGIAYRGNVNFEPEFFHGAVEKMTGYTEQDFMEGKIRWDSIIHKDDLPGYLEKVKERIQDKPLVAESEFRIVHRNGSIRWIHEIFQTIFDDSGQVIGSQGIQYDLTERKRAEEAYKALVEHSLQGLAIIRDGQVVFANPAVVELSGYTMEELLALSPEQVKAVVHPEDQERIWGNMMKRLAGELVLPRQEFRFIQKDGKVRWVETMASRIEYQGRPAVQVTYVDITERKRAEEALRASEENYRELADSITDVFFAMDQDLRYTYWNKASESLTGIRAEDALGKSLLEVFSDTPWVRRAEKVYRDVLGMQQPQAFVNDTDLGGRRYVFEISAYPSRSGISVFVKDITERKRAEEALRVAEERFSKAFHASPDAMTISRMADGTLFEVNDMWEKTLGYSRAESVGTSSVALGIWSDPAIRQKAVQQLQETGSLRNFETDLRRKTGEVRQVSLSSERLEIGGEQCLLTVIHDITERKRVEEALHKSEEKYRSFAQNLHGIAYKGNVNFEPEFFHGSVEEITGYTEQEFMEGKIKWDNIIHKDDLSDYLKKVKERILHRPSRAESEFRIVRRDGSIRWIHEAFQTIFDQSGEVIGSQGIQHDITERKQVEEALRESEERYRAVVEDQMELICRFSLDGTLTFVNEAYCRYFGKRPEELIGHSCMPLIPEEDREIVRQQFRSLSLENPVMTYEHRVVTPSGEICWQQWSDRAIWDEQGHIIEFQSVGRDITERVRAEEARVRSQRLLLALSQAAQAVQRAHTSDEVYRTIGDEVVRLSYHAAVFTLTDDREHLAFRYMTFKPTLVRRIGKLTGLSAQDFRFPLVPGSFFQRIIAEGEAAFSKTFIEVIADALPLPVRPLAGRVAIMLGIEQGIVAPLMVGDETYGILAVTGVGLTEADVPAVTAFASQAAIAIENARLFEQMQAAREQLRDLAGYLQAAREEERTQIAREIHDEFGQALSALKMDLSWLSKRLPADQPHLAEKASAMSDLIDSAIQTVRRVATELRPGLLDDLGLAATMEWQAEEFAERTGIDCDLYLSDEEIVLERDLATAIFRIFQETLTNVARHAQATEVHVELEDRPDELVLIVCDNGSGITESQVSHPRSLGLMGMRERARSWGGEVAFHGVPGQGTTVTVRIPNVEFGMRNSESSR